MIIYKMVMSIYSAWSEKDYDKFCAEDWGITEGWEDDCWASHFLSCNFKQEWSCEELMKSLKEETLSESEIYAKYLE